MQVNIRCWLWSHEVADLLTGLVCETTIYIAGELEKEVEYARSKHKKQHALPCTVRGEGGALLRATRVYMIKKSSTPPPIFVTQRFLMRDCRILHASLTILGHV